MPGRNPPQPPPLPRRFPPTPRHPRVAKLPSPPQYREHSGYFHYYRASRIVDLPSHANGLQPPSWAVNEPLRRFTQLQTVLTLEKALLINTPFTGEYYPSRPERPRSLPKNLRWSTYPHPQRQYEQYQKVALAVFARFDTEKNRVWLAARKIHIAETEEGRRAELTWISLENWGLLEKVLVKPGFQVFVPKKVFTMDGVLDAEKVRGGWLDMIVRSEERARIRESGLGNTP
ncbi:hypothetical protein K458DRAFT_387001 [Lentithecium fluviatile CBS 122367]|uniref:Uncharacterized protein n=1 Tax=Lentithecium fluviatile CBS 122367 TaxID=1168545 RepID=A0A6G1J6Y3_9PLEO|nr:hypothetical protein K458DRAFT_387001 [Lentithecium fluviatile CBS 122367]